MVLNFILPAVSAFILFIPACYLPHITSPTMHDDFYQCLTNWFSFLRESDQLCLQRGSLLMSSCATTSCCTQLHVHHGLFCRWSSSGVIYFIVGDRAACVFFPQHVLDNRVCAPWLFQPYALSSGDLTAVGAQACDRDTEGKLPGQWASRDATCIWNLVVDKWASDSLWFCQRRALMWATIGHWLPLSLEAFFGGAARIFAY